MDAADLLAPVRETIERLERERDEYRADNEWLERENRRLGRQIEALETELKKARAA